MIYLPILSDIAGFLSEIFTVPAKAVEALNILFWIVAIVAIIIIILILYLLLRRRKK